MWSMADPVVRALQLLDLLQSAAVCSTADLARRLEVDERTVRRDVARLIAAGIHIESLRGRYGGYRLAPGSRVLPITFTGDEAVAVFLGLAHTRSPAGERDGAPQTALAKIRRAMRPQDAERGDAALALIRRSVVTGRADPAPGVILTMAQAIASHQVVELRYRNGDGVPSSRTVHPIDLVARSDRWYLVAFDVDRGADRAFRVDRISTARALPERFPAPERGDTRSWLEEHFATGTYRWTVVLHINATEQHIREHLPPSVARLRRRDAGPGDSSPWHRAEIHADALDWLPSAITGLACTVLIEGPPELRELVRTAATRMLRAAADDGPTPASAPAVPESATETRHTQEPTRDDQPQRGDRLRGRVGRPRDRQTRQTR